MTLPARTGVTGGHRVTHGDTGVTMDRASPPGPHRTGCTDRTTAVFGGRTAYASDDR